MLIFQRNRPLEFKFLTSCHSLLKYGQIIPHAILINNYYNSEEHDLNAVAVINLLLNILVLLLNFSVLVIRVCLKLKRNFLYNFEVLIFFATVVLYLYTCISVSLVEYLMEAQNEVNETHMDETIENDESANETRIDYMLKVAVERLRRERYKAIFLIPAIHFLLQCFVVALMRMKLNFIESDEGTSESQSNGITLDDLFSCIKWYQPRNEPQPADPAAAPAVTPAESAERTEVQETSAVSSAAEASAEETSIPKSPETRLLSQRRSKLGELPAHEETSSSELASLTTSSIAFIASSSGSYSASYNMGSSAGLSATSETLRGKESESEKLTLSSLKELAETATKVDSKID